LKHTHNLKLALSNFWSVRIIGSVTESAVELELDAQYRTMREGAGLLDRSERGKVKLTGADAAEYLHSQITNDVEGLEPGQGAYAALLDRKGHIQADMRVLRLSPGEIWIDVEPAALEGVLKHLRMYSIGREVEIADVGAEWAITSLIGPASPTVSGVEGLGPEHAQRVDDSGGTEILAVATDLGIDLITKGEDAAGLRARLAGGGAEPVTEEAAEIVRVESGRPRLGPEMGPEHMPAEAGIVERAIDFEKGCYIGQEPVARLHYKGRPNRTLRGLRLSASAPTGSALRLGEKEVGAVGTTAISPAHGPIALAIVRREAETGDTVEVDGAGEAEVVELPFTAG
jgi:folate-binding protein YgfZ